VDTIGAIQVWRAETTAILTTAVRLAEYFGSDEELASLQVALAGPLLLLQVVQRHPEADPRAPSAPRPNFECSEHLARMLTPLLQLVCEPIPDFVRIARQELVAEDAKVVIAAFGVFAGNFAMHICAPVWRKHPQLAPDGWPL
jgi:hypothetical protein